MVKNWWNKLIIVTNFNMSEMIGEPSNSMEGNDMPQEGLDLLQPSNHQHDSDEDEWHREYNEAEEEVEEEEEITMAEDIAESALHGITPYNQKLLEENYCEITCTRSATNYKKEGKEYIVKQRYRTHCTDPEFRKWIICIRVYENSQWFNGYHEILRTDVWLFKEQEETRFEMMAEVQLILSGSSPLIHAVWKGSLEKVQQLVEQGVDVNQKNYRGVSALECAIDPYMFPGGPVHITDIRIVQALISGGADVNMVNKRRRSLVEIAIDMRQKDVVSLLIKEGARVERSTQQLIEREDLRNSSGGFKKLTSLLGNIQIVQKFISKGGDINMMNSRGQSLLEIALKLCLRDTASFLIKSRAQVEKLTPSCLIENWQVLADIALTAERKDFTISLINARLQVSICFKETSIRENCIPYQSPKSLKN